MPSQTPEQYHEVTAAERTKLEAADAAFVPPAREIINLYQEATGCRYNEEIGFFELNELTDITELQMRDIYLFGKTTFMQDCECALYVNGSGRHLRTNWTQVNRSGLPIIAKTYLLGENQTFETFCIPCIQDSESYILKVNDPNFLSKCTKLRKIIGRIRLDVASAPYSFLTGCGALEEVEITRLSCSLNIAHLPKLNYASVRYLIEHATPPAAGITLTVAPAVYNRIATASGEWHDLLSIAQEKNITIASS